MTTTKPGIQTTEFWTTIITNAIGIIAVLHPGFTAPPGLAQALAALAAGVATLAYSYSRATVKTASATPAPAPSTAAAAAALRQVAAALDPPPAA